MPFDGDAPKAAKGASDDFAPETYRVIPLGCEGSRQESTQSVLSSINLASREQRAPQQSYPFHLASHTQTQGDWTGNLASEQNDEPFLQRFDTEMSSSDQQTTASNQPTPNMSHHSSSNTSYSSPHLVDDANPSCTLTATPDSHPGFFSTDRFFAGFTPPENPQYPLPASRKSADGGIGGFETWRALPPPAGRTSSAGSVGLSPMGEGEWSRIMEGMGWDGGGLGTGGEGEGMRGEG